MMRIILCDDDIKMHKEYSKKIIALARKRKVKIELINFMSGKDMLRKFTEPDFYADVIFLDIRMPDLEGDVVAQMLRAQGYKNDIIFFTFSTKIEHFRKAMRYKALDYVIKGVTTDDEFEQIFVETVNSYREREREYISLSFAGETRNIAINEIQYFEYKNRKITVYYNVNKTFQFWDSLDRFEKQLEFYGFLRVHSAFLVQMGFVDSIKRGELVLKNGTSIYFNKNHTARFRKSLENFTLADN